MPHGSAMLDLHHAFPVANASVMQQKPLSRPCRDLLEELQHVTRVRRDATNGVVLGPWRVLHPDAADKFRRGQDYAVAMLGRFEGVNVLVLPDLGLAGQNSLFNRLEGVRADIVIAGLPDTGQPLASEIIERVAPRLIVIADCEFPAARRAPPDLRRRLQRCGVPVIFTRELGAIHLWMRNGQWRTTGTLK
jgi:hypothetical protein